MKKFGCMVLGLCMCMGLLAGCGKTVESESSVVYVEKNGAVISLDVEELAQDYYDAEELENFVNDAVSEYTEEHGRNSVKVQELKVEEGTARLQMKYKTTADYSAFNGIELYQGKVIDSLAAGYVFDGEFARVEEGKVIGAATKQEIYAEDDLKVVIIRANTDVQVDGQICYISCKNVELTGTNSVSIREGYYTDTGSKVPPVNMTPDEAVDATEELMSTEMIEIPVEIPDDGSFETEVYTFIVYK